MYVSDGDRILVSKPIDKAHINKKAVIYDTEWKVINTNELIHYDVEEFYELPEVK
jgi:hypothetical protein